MVYKWYGFVQEHSCHHVNTRIGPRSIHLNETYKQCGNVGKGLHPYAIKTEELFTRTGEGLELKNNVNEVDRKPATGRIAIEIGWCDLPVRMVGNTYWLIDWLID